MHRVSAFLERTHLNQFPIFLLLIFSSLILSCCKRSPVTPDFGAPYDIVMDYKAGAPESPPRITDDWLFINIYYEGGCLDHSFSLEKELRRDTAHIWLRHSKPATDPCTDPISDELRLQLPIGVHTHHTIALHIPPGGPPFMLKWR